MVVHPTLPGVNVTVAVQGNEAKEWHDSTLKEDDDRTITRYIEAVSDAAFSIKLEVDKSSEFKGNCYICNILLDGAEVAAPIISGAAAKKRGSHFERSSMHAEGQEWPFRFSCLEMNSEGNDSNVVTSKYKNIGRICVNLRHAKAGKPTAPVIDRRPLLSNKYNTLSEKARKGKSITHTTCFGTPKEAQKTRFYNTKHVEHEDYDVRYIFRYRSKDMLKSMCVIPRTPSPEPFEQADFSELSREELLTRITEYQAVINSNVRIKRERNEETHAARKKARREANLSQTAGHQATVLELDGNGDFVDNIQPIDGGEQRSVQEIVEID